MVNDWHLRRKDAALSEGRWVGRLVCHSVAQLKRSIDFIDFVEQEYPSCYMVCGKASSRKTFLIKRRVTPTTNSLFGLSLLIRG